MYICWVYSEDKIYLMTNIKISATKKNNLIKFAIKKLYGQP
jgi:hypothetical protein